MACQVVGLFIVVVVVGRKATEDMGLRGCRTFQCSYLEVGNRVLGLRGFGTFHWSYSEVGTGVYALGGRGIRL